MNEDLYEVSPGPRGFPPVEAYRAIKLVIFDVDGVLTDARIVIDSKGVESKFFDVRDGAGITLLRHAGFKVAFLTGRSSAVVDFRARELGIPPELVRQGAQVKLPVFKQLLADAGASAAECVYVGDDIIDTPVLAEAGLACCPGNSHPEVVRLCHVVAARDGGRGGVRAIVEHFLKRRGDGSWERAVGRYLGKDANEKPI